MRTCGLDALTAVAIAMTLLAVAGCGGPDTGSSGPGGEPAAVPADRPDTAGAAVPAGNETPADGDWLISVLPAEMEHLNPFTSQDAYSSRINDLIFENLVDLDNETLDIIPELAESWTISEDKLTYTFTMREGVTFSDGQPLTARDVKFSFDKATDPGTDAPQLRNYFQDVTACELVDENTVRFTCNKPYFRHLLVLGSLEIIPEHIYGEGDFNNHPNNRNPIGSGPYLLEKWNTGEILTLVRNEAYWGEKPHILKRVYRVITNPDVALSALEQQEADITGLTPEQWTTRGEEEGFQADFNRIKYNSTGYSYIGWNMRRPQFSDKRVRRALTMLLDREAILRDVYYGLGQITTGNFFIDEPEYNKAIKPWPFDPEAAEALLDEAGWIDTNRDGTRDKNGQPFAFELLLTGDNPTSEKIATIYEEELGASGIEMTIRRLEWASFLQNVQEQDFDAAMLGWSLPPYPDPYQVWHSSQTVKMGSNAVGFENEEADKIIEAGRLEFDREKRIAMYHRFHEIVHEEQPYTFLFAPKSLLVVQKRFRNIIVYPYGPDSREWWVPKALQRHTSP